ncbi:Peptidase family M23 [Meiothermus luteus]|uniref:Peptidase family M23 n=1 Tax=Meiothermus luteus TaxID=2026184 RepID=A0A399EXB8_9DEIN|nr:peptidoglycan DD-metalloendopeptidase family protein [Meiothermus luteus]RIH89204.1 Peptidase family M23 [Meiothermus luteus]RMH55753.1 MAG: M23 family metallopeptidase [Deinococcota bacterium]
MPIKPGWILLVLVALLALWQGLHLSGARRQVASLQAEVDRLKKQLELGPEGFTLPLPGACLPRSEANLPGAPRPYRKGVNPGFVFVDGDACVPVRYGMGVVAAAGGEVIKAELDYKEPTRAELEALFRAVANGATPAQMDRLRGREVWIRHTQGFTTVYAHLSEIAPGVRVGARVHKGQWIGRVGNSGTEAALRGQEGARLLFELWDGEPDKDRYFGQGLSPQALRARARLEFGLP